MLCTSNYIIIIISLYIYIYIYMGEREGERERAREIEREREREGKRDNGNVYMLSTVTESSLCIRIRSRKVPVLYLNPWQIIQQIECIAVKFAYADINSIWCHTQRTLGFGLDMKIMPVQLHVFLELNNVIHWGLVTHTGITEFSNHWLR